MQETTARETPGAGSDQLQAITTPDPIRDQRSITIEVEGRIMEVSIEEMELYCDLFEEMFVELDKRKFNRIEGLEGLLDEFDHAEIEHLRLRYGTPCPS